MNENLNLVDILRDCPRGTKLYSTIFGCVDFEYIENKEIIVTNNISGDTEIFNQNGSWHYGYTNECMLFPTKDQRDWSKFKVELEMVDGEFYYCSLFNSVNDSIYIHRKSEGYKTEYYVKLDLFDLALLKNCIITTHEGYIKELRKATEEEKQQLLNVIKREGYKWDEEKKELVKDESRFNINTLQPFDRVLVRNGNDNWTCTLFSNIITNERRFFKCINSIWIQCVPYNDETKYLVGTKKMPPEKYITWEG